MSASAAGKNNASDISAREAAPTAHKGMVSNSAAQSTITTAAEKNNQRTSDAPTNSKKASYA